MGASDKALGGAMLLTASVVFVYYTAWAILLPFFDPSSQLHDFFPPREWAIRLPAFILVIGLSAIGTFVGSTIVRENRKKALKARLRTA
ncbi:hypothetical protein L208DRAFT_249022 [Tricholoma matsutake]|nr:hypothetical protein L208DRAFT_249022 [Tricholoma matsutake 945]